jgi:hypothetical protein
VKNGWKKCAFTEGLFFLYFELKEELAVAFFAVWLQSNIQKEIWNFTGYYCKSTGGSRIVSMNRDCKYGQHKKCVFKLLSRLKQTGDHNYFGKLKRKFRREIFFAQDKFYITSLHLFKYH